MFDVRSVLFLPASNPRAIEKARAAGADMVILDLEDSVRSEDKAFARQAAVSGAAQDWPCLVAIRVNAVGSEWHRDDLKAVGRSLADFVVLPRAVQPDDARSVAAATGKPVLAMIETAAGVLASADIATECAALIAGTNDLAADLRLPAGAGRGPMQTALQTIVLAARSRGVACFDGVFNRLEDLAGFAAEAAESRQLGFDGKSLIHPNQVAPCHRAFAPAQAELDRAQRLIEAFGGGAGRFEGEMIERMHVETARRLIARAGA
ncbi:CoA ester lyase [Sphingomonas sinipercae]|uniref:CoA ester lyase n=1 Tax=Sphingomonas sinipercae TaxID=2714944 RepID=A0A6G7ZQX6_9SPHN|nr:CoA ester lyase [Sphingomonas sinipercae]